MPPMISITRRPAEAGIYPSVRWWAVALLDRSTFVGNYLYIMDETSHYRWHAALVRLACRGTQAETQATVH